VLAVVPVKGRDGAKTRLAPVLSPAERARLVLDMLGRVLVACAEADAITGTLLVTPDPGVAPTGVDVLRDAGTGHADAVAEALAAAAMPLALVPSRDGGVNALALRPLNGFVPSFGVPVEMTLAAARAAGLDAAVIDDPLLALDVDSPEDYEAMLACL
jgi:2-phospho-L-lactate guanylyltransferase (CobY/MobA/RfbA family)